MGLLTLSGPMLQMSWGDFLSLLCALAFSAHILVLGHYGQRPEIQNLALTQLIVVAVLSLGSFWWAERPFLDPTPALGATIVWTSVMCTALAFTLMVWAQRYTVPSRAALIFALEPVFAWITNFLITGERLSLRSTCGAALILGGVLFVELKPMRMREHPSL
jgi:drug/metabolite transporter (DMT)-like permease